LVMLINRNVPIWESSNQRKPGGVYQMSDDKNPKAIFDDLEKEIEGAILENMKSSSNMGAPLGMKEIAAIRSVLDIPSKKTMAGTLTAIIKHVDDGQGTKKDLVETLRILQLKVSGNVPELRKRIIAYVISWMEENEIDAEEDEEAEADEDTVEVPRWNVPFWQAIDSRDDKGELDKALECLEESLKEHPDAVQLLIQKSICLIQKNELKDARKSVEKALSAQKDNGEAGMIKEYITMLETDALPTGSGETKQGGSSDIDPARLMRMIREPLAEMYNQIDEKLESKVSDLEEALNSQMDDLSQILARIIGKIDNLGLLQKATTGQDEPKSTEPETSASKPPAISKPEAAEGFKPLKASPLSGPVPARPLQPEGEIKDEKANGSSSLDDIRAGLMKISTSLDKHKGNGEVSTEELPVTEEDKGPPKTRPRPKPSFDPSESFKLTTGDSLIDRSLGGGVGSGLNVMVNAPPFTGRETVLYQLVANSLTDNIPCIIIATDDDPDTILQGIKKLKPDLDDEVERSLIRWVDIEEDGFVSNSKKLDQENLDIPGKYQEILNTVWVQAEGLMKEHGKYCMVVSSISPLLSFYEPKEINRFLDRLSKIPRDDNIIGLYTLDQTMHESKEIGFVTRVMDGVIEIMKKPPKMANELPSHYIKVAKMRGTQGTDWLHFEYTAEGFQVKPVRSYDTIM